jgi:uncharacterized coiled-coil DUF342 family protein
MKKTKSLFQQLHEANQQTSEMQKEIEELKKDAIESHNHSQEQLVKLMDEFDTLKQSADDSIAMLQLVLPTLNSAYPMYHDVKATIETYKKLI